MMELLERFPASLSGAAASRSVGFLCTASEQYRTDCKALSGSGQAPRFLSYIARRRQQASGVFQHQRIRRMSSPKSFAQSIRTSISCNRTCRGSSTDGRSSTSHPPHMISTRALAVQFSGTLLFTRLICAQDFSVSANFDLEQTSCLSRARRT
jgi:hypothetical protein